MPPLTADALDRRLLAWTRGDAGDEALDALLLDVYRHQYAHNAPYRRWCDLREGDPTRVADWRAIPAVPQVAFKEWTLAAFDVAHAVACFESSGTTQGTPSRHHFDTLALYEAALVPPFRTFVLPDGATLPCLALVAAPETAPASSLSHMAGVVGSACCDGVRYFVEDGDLQTDAMLHACEAADGPVLIFTTAFALVHLLDACNARDVTLALPPGSRMLETGGYKGRTREIPKADLYAWAARRLGLAETHIVNEYGMAELSSQWYDTVLRETHAGRPARGRCKAGPPWVRARVLDPQTGHDVEPGEIGLLRLYDPMNRGSVCCIQTEDVGRQLPGGFEVLGRATDAELRGCSLELDTF